jgi:hypothetical protein
VPVIVSHEARALFVHVQKTGGSTLQTVLLGRLPGAESVTGLPGAKHAHLEAALELRPELAAYWTFGFVRNPWARLWSWWSMIERRKDQRDEGHAWAVKRVANNAFWSGVINDLPDFEAFVMAGPDRFARLRETQLSYLVAGERRADFIGRTESFDADFGRVCDRLGIEPPPEETRRNAQPEGAGASGSYRDHYTAGMRDRVAGLFRADVDEFGYEF